MRGRCSSCFACCGRLHHGEIREQGTHEELLRKGELYARLHELQFVRTPAA